MDLEISRVDVMPIADGDETAYIHVELRPLFPEDSGLSGGFTAVVQLRADSVMNATLGELQMLAAQQIRLALQTGR